MVPPQIGDSLENIKTEPKMAGSDPTLNTLIVFNLPLPQEELFTPRMSVTVYDSIAMGIKQPIIGNFVIDVGQLMRDLEKERQEEKDDLEHVLLQIKKMVMGEAVAASMRTKIKAKTEEMVKEQMEEDLRKQQIEAAEKEVLNQQMRQGNQNSINESNLDTAPLLQGDHDEETRQSERVKEAERAAVDGAKTRLDE